MREAPLSRIQIFVSYARDDDDPPPDMLNAKGFVTFLHEQLTFEFKRLGPFRPKIWRDAKRVEPADQFEERISEAIGASSILLVILSRNWLGREFCLKELQQFRQRWGSHTSEEMVKHRIVVVGKHHVPLDRRPSLLVGQEGFKFYDVEDLRADYQEDNEIVNEYEFFARGQIRDARYHSELEKLAGYLWRTASRMEKENKETLLTPPPAPSPAMTGRPIYVAKPANDMREAYDRIVKELRGRGYCVVPDPSKDIPLNSSAVDFVDEALDAAETSIHLLGEKTGGIPEDSEPIVKLQLTRAAAKVGRVAVGSASTSCNFRRIVWAPKVMYDGIGPPHGGVERDPIKVLEKFDRQLETDKVDGSTISDFVNFLGQTLERTIPAAANDGLDKVGGNGRIYVYHRYEDRRYAINLAKALQGHNLEPILPAVQGDDIERSAHHRQNLMDCDSVVLCWATASEVWAKTSSRELKNWRDLGRSQRFKRRGLVVGPPPGEVKTDFIELLPRSEIDVVLDLTSVENPSPVAVGPLVIGSDPINS